MTQDLTRRELREAERRGEAANLQPAPQPKTAPPSRPAQQQSSFKPAKAPEQQLTRRRMREMGLLGSPSPVDAAPASPATALQQADSRRARRAATQEPRTIDAPEVEMPEPTFTGQNLLSEPSTASIVLDQMPEAMALPIETGEIAVTGSIEVISGPMTGPTTAALQGMDGIELDDAESVTGVISTVEPISALQLIDERSGFVAVPSKVLRKGWWKPWLVGAGSVGLVGVAILSVMTILSAVGG